MKKKVKQVRPRNSGPTLRFSPYAWAKLLAFRDYGPTEIAGFGVSGGDDPLLIEDFITVKQACTSVTVAMDDGAVADYFDERFDEGHKPDQFMRIWLHTHPGDSAQPSGTDEETFERVFGQCDWAIMAILARGGQTYARLRFGVGPGAQLLIPVQVDFSVLFPGTDHQAWQAEYQQHVMQEPMTSLRHLLGEKPNASDNNPHEHRSQHWHQQDAWDIHDLNDLEALADLEAELEAELAGELHQREMEVGFDSR